MYSIRAKVIGAAGGLDYSSPYTFPGGLGGSIVADLSVTPGTTLCIYVGMILLRSALFLYCVLDSINLLPSGSMGTSRTASTYGACAGGYNGGGVSGKYLGGGGGGASDIRTICSNYGSVLVVAGGGGGGKGLADCFSNGLRTFIMPPS